MNNEWKIDLSTQRNLRDYYKEKGQTNIANSVKHTESVYEGKTIFLLTLQELQLTQQNNPNETLISIFGEEVVASKCDDGTRFGYVAYGRLA